MLRHHSSQPQLYVRSPRKYSKPEAFPREYTPPTGAPMRILPHPPSTSTSPFLRRVSQSQLPITPPAHRILRRQPQSDLSYRFQRVEAAAAAAAAAATQRVESVRESDTVDPVYLALKQATGRYGGGSRRSSNSNFDSSTPSPRNLSQGSLLDSGYADVEYRGKFMGSTPQLNQTDMGSTGRSRRAPKLNKQMKSLSLDCAEKSPTNAPIRSRDRPTRATGSSDMSEWERSCSPVAAVSPRPPPPPRIHSAVSQQRLFKEYKGAGDHIVIHEYQPLVLGDRLFVVDNGDPDWLHGFRIGEHGSETLLTFPSTCVAKLLPGEQPMKIVQNVHIPDRRLRLYRDQVVFAQQDSITEKGRVCVRTEHNALVFCPLQHLILLP